MFPQTRGVWLETGDLEEFQEQEPNETLETATAAKANAVLNGRIQAPGDMDVWRLEAFKDTPLELHLRAARLNSPLDSVLTIQDVDGKTVAESDDIASGQTDSRLQFNPPAHGVYYVTITDRFARRGDPRFGYRLYLRPASSLPTSFALKFPADTLNLTRGGEAKVKITADRQNGFVGAIQLVIEGLPEGVTVDETTIAADKNEATLTLKATPKAPVSVVRLMVQGRCEQDGATVEMIAKVAESVCGDPPNEHLWLV